MSGEHSQDLADAPDQVADRPARAKHRSGLMDRLPHWIVCGIAAQEAIHSRVRTQSRGRQCDQRKTVARSRENQLVTASESCLMVGQDRAYENAKVGLCHRSENAHGNTLTRLT